VIVVTALLAAMVAYLTRGRGDKALLLQEIRNSKRLGPKVADWVQANEAALIAHPKLQPRKPAAGGGGQPPAPPPKPPKEPGREPGPGAPRGMPPHKVPCFKADGLPRSKLNEFDRQLAGQQKGLNDLTVDEYLRGRDAFMQKQVKRSSKVAGDARAEFEKGLLFDISEELREQGTPRQKALAEAAKQAAAKMQTLNALHNPDLVTGGKDVIADFGDASVNKSIGAHWNKKNRLNELDKAARALPEGARGNKMNVRLERCK
jgi:hypothetical protein